MKTKKCSACGVVKPITEFHKNRASKDGVNCICKVCNIKKVKEYFNRNKESRAQYNKEYYINNREYVSQYNKEYYINNREKLREYFASPRGRLVDKAKKARRKARKSGNTPKELLLTTKQLETLYETTTHCPYCGVELATVKIELDHVYPLSRGGQHSLDNVVLCCAHCNRSKGAREPIEWMLENNVDFGFMTKAGYVSAYSTE